MNLLNFTHFRRVIAATTLLFSLGVFAFPFNANAQSAPAGVTIQGQLKDLNGDPYSLLNLDFRLSFWGDADYDATTDNSAGTLVGAGHVASVVTNISTDANGFFFFNLTDLPASFDASAHRYLQVEARPAGGAITAFKLLDYIASNDAVDRKDASYIGAFAQTANYATSAGDAATVGGLDLATYYREPVANAAALAAITDMVAGTVVYQTDTSEVKFYDGSAWNTLGEDNAAALTALTTRVTNNESDIAALQSDMTQAQTDITTAQTTANNAVTAAAAAQSTANTNATNIANNATDIATNTADIATNTSDIATNAAAIAANDTDIAANAAAAAAAQTTANTAQTAANTNATAITALQSDMTQAQSDIASLSSAISGLTWLSPVSNFADIATTYATPSEGDVVAVTGEGTAYIYTVAGGWEALVQDFVIANATTTQAGIVELATDGETTAGLAVQANDSRLAQVAVNTASIATNTADLATANTNISNNTANITTNATNIATNATDIAAIQSDLTTQTTNISDNANEIAQQKVASKFDVYAVSFN